MKLFFPSVWLNLTHPVTYVCDTCTSTSMYCLSSFIYHLSAPWLLSCDLPILPSPQPSYRHSWNHWNFIVAYWKQLGWIVFSDNKRLAKKIKENWIKLKKFFLNVNYNSFFVTLFCFIKSMLLNSVHNAAIHYVFKKLPSLFYFLDFTKPKSLLKTPCSNLYWLEGDNRGAMLSILPSQYYFPALNGPVFHVLVFLELAFQLFFPLRIIATDVI